MFEIIFFVLLNKISIPQNCEFSDPEKSHARSSKDIAQRYGYSPVNGRARANFCLCTSHIHRSSYYFLLSQNLICLSGFEGEHIIKARSWIRMWNDDINMASHKACWELKTNRNKVNFFDSLKHELIFMGKFPFTFNFIIRLLRKYLMYADILIIIRDLLSSSTWFPTDFGSHSHVMSDQMFSRLVFVVADLYFFLSVRLVGGSEWVVFQ